MSTTAPLDGFSGFSEEVEGVERSQGASAGQGTMLKFTENGKWVTGAGDPMSLECELVVVDLHRIVQKWIDGMPVEKIIVEPGKKFPNVEAMNNAAPRSEWREYRGKMIGPWQMEYVVYLLDAATLDSYWFPTSTTGGGMCCRDIARKIAWMRQYRGPKVSAVVTLSDTFMNTQWGGRQRPHFQIVRWIGFDQAAAPEVKPPAPKPVLESGAAATPETPPWKEIKEPTLAEEMGDAIPDYDDDVSNI
jgi:hypothetical protein